MEGKTFESDYGASKELSEELKNQKTEDSRPIVIKFSPTKDLYVVERLTDVFTRQVQSIWHDAQIDPADDYNIFNHTGTTSCVWVKQKDAASKHDHYNPEVDVP